MRISDQALLALISRKPLKTIDESKGQKITCHKHGFAILFDLCQECVKKCERYYQLSNVLNQK